MTEICFYFFFNLFKQTIIDTFTPCLNSQRWSIGFDRTLTANNESVIRARILKINSRMICFCFLVKITDRKEEENVYDFCLCDRR